MMSGPRVPMAAPAPKPLPERHVWQGLCLQQIQPEHLPLTMAWRNRDDVRCWFNYSGLITVEQHQAWYEAYLTRSNDMLYVLEDLATGRALGQLGMYDIGPEQAEVGRFIAAPEARGQGVMRLACAELCRLGLEELGLQRLLLQVLPHNQRAQALYRELGFIDCAPPHAEAGPGPWMQRLRPLPPT